MDMTGVYGGFAESEGKLMSRLHQGSFTLVLHPHREERGLTVKGSLRQGTEQSYPLYCIYQSENDSKRHVLDCRCSIVRAVGTRGIGASPALN